MDKDDIARCQECGDEIAPEDIDDPFWADNSCSSCKIHHTHLAPTEERSALDREAWEAFRFADEKKKNNE